MTNMVLIQEIETVLGSPDRPTHARDRYILHMARRQLLKQPLPDTLSVTVECRECQYLLHASAVERTTDDNVLNVKIRIDPHDCGRGPYSQRKDS